MNFYKFLKYILVGNYFFFCSVVYCKTDEEKIYKSLLNKWSSKKQLYGVKVNLTFETKELTLSWIKYLMREKSEEEISNYCQKISDEEKGRICFRIEIDNKGGFNYLKLDNIKENIVLEDNRGKIYYPDVWDSELQEVFTTSLAGRVCFSGEIITKKTKWIKVKIYRLFFYQIPDIFKTNPDFEFYFSLKKKDLKNILW